MVYLLFFSVRFLSCDFSPCYTLRISLRHIEFYLPHLDSPPMRSCGQESPLLFLVLKPMFRLDKIDWTNFRISSVDVEPFGRK
jgi:hypothetical protein